MTADLRTLPDVIFQRRPVDGAQQPRKVLDVASLLDLLLAETAKVCRAGGILPDDLDKGMDYQRGQVCVRLFLCSLGRLIGQIVLMRL